MRYDGRNSVRVLPVFFISFGLNVGMLRSVFPGWYRFWLSACPERNVRCNAPVEKIDDKIPGAITGISGKYGRFTRKRICFKGINHFKSGFTFCRSGSN